MRALLGLASVVCAAAVGCASEYPPPGATRDATDSARGMLLVALDRTRRRSFSARDTAQVDSVGLSFSAAQSEVVPGLTYHWLAYHDPQVDHDNWTVVLAERASVLEILASASDWGVVAQGWRAKTESEAAKACLELVSALTDWRWLAASARWPDDSMRLSYLEPVYGARRMAPVRARLRDSARPVLTRDSTLWRVDAWAYQPSWTAAAYRYQCTLPRSPEVGAGAYSLRLTDSIGPRSPGMERGGPRGFWNWPAAP
jgi:hypothetical protein